MFQSSVVNKHLAGLDEVVVKHAYSEFSKYFHNPTIQDNIRNSKEEQFQEGFLRELFVKILGYKINPEPDFDLTTELKNIGNAKKTDGAILKDGKAVAVIELKGTDTKDLNKVNEQAFGYKNQQPDCEYVITSNFEKLRFFIHNTVEHEEFDLFQLNEERFKLLWLLLQSDSLLSGIPLKLKEQSLLAEEEVTKKLYKDYSSFKTELWQNICAVNKEHDPLLLYQKSQKLLDRFLFIFFAEDKGLLPPNSISRMVERYDLLKREDAEKPLYDIFKQFFGYLNDGRKGTTGNPLDDIAAYNGGLFAEDELLDSLLINDEMLRKHVMCLTAYNFETEVDTNILGHIFEHSLNDIENVRAQLAGEEVDKKKSKRKKDGVFYTPKYITKYIVDNTVGRLCEEKKNELGWDEEEFAKDRKGRKKATLKKLDKQIKDYRAWLLEITICDPACGSGAFLNQALEFLMAEHRYIDAMESELLGHAMVFEDVENHILEKNIYGVDINEESVEIARLSLWLRTAQRGRKLNTLSSNIKVGNSLIDDPEVAGELAFDWEMEFPQVFAKGGFDVVIGNPPWGAELSKPVKNFLKVRFDSIDSSTPNSYAYFMGLATKLSDTIGYVIPDSFLLKDFKKSRELFKDGIEKLTWYQNTGMPDKLKPFAEVDHDVIGFTYFKGSDFRKLSYELRWYEKGIKEHSYRKLKADIIEPKYFSIFNLLLDDVSIGLKRRLVELNTFDEEVQIHEGIHTGNCRDLLFVKSQSRGDEKPLYYGGKAGDIVDNYYSMRAGWFVDYRKEIIDKSNGLYASLRDEDIFKYPKVYITRTGNPFKCFIDTDTYASNNFFSLQANDLAYNTVELLSVFVSILNSKFAQYYIRNLIAPRIGSAFVETKIIHLLKLPLPLISDEFRRRCSQLVERTVNARRKYWNHTSSFINHVMGKFLVDKPSKKLQNWPELDFKGFLAELKKKKIKLSLEEEAEWMEYFNKKQAEANALQAEIDRIDKEIDQMVYELYGLTEAEIAIVEESTK